MSAELKQRIFDAVMAQNGTLLLDGELSAIVDAIRAEPLLTARGVEILRHAVGVRLDRPPDGWGYRNYFDAGEKDLPELRRLELLGLVRTLDGSVWAVTPLGGHVAGLSQRQVARACRAPATPAPSAPAPRPGEQV